MHRSSQLYFQAISVITSESGSNTWKVLKCYVGKGWRRSVEPIMREMKKSYKESRREEYPTNKRRRKANWIGHIFV